MRLHRALCALLGGLFLLTGCFDSDNKKLVGPSNASHWIVPVERYGISMEQVAKIEQGRGLKTVYAEDVRTLTSTPTQQDTILDITYFFDEIGQYQVAKVRYASPEIAQAFISDYLENNGFVNSGLRTSNEHETIYISDARGSRVASIVLAQDDDTAPTFWWGSNSDSKQNWLRINPMKDEESGLWLPLLPAGASLEMVHLFEARMGHTFNKEKSIPERGVFLFDTQDARYPQVKYWLDLETNKFLSENKIICDINNRPTPPQVDAYLQSLGFEATRLSDANGNSLYYDESLHLVACPEFKIPEDKEKAKNFMPGIQFYNQDLSNSLPYKQVDLPWPLLDIGKISMKEAREQYSKLPYTAAVKDAREDFPFPVVEIRSMLFPQIILVENEGKYGGALIVCDDMRAFYSPAVFERLEAEGFIYDEKRTVGLPTYSNEAKGLMVQFDAGLIMPFATIAFSPIENLNTTTGISKCLHQASSFR